ncbi:hypothetical protein [Streptomyces sp. NPDC088757]|uniref:hypothetical protein n=1 Tax=Streptomyces sp. NPDC088757 TaxID=3365889 RepID=UPI0038276653
MSQTEGARLFRETWIAGVHRHFPGEQKGRFVATSRTAQICGHFEAIEEAPG